MMGSNTRKRILVINSKRPYPVCDGAAIRSMQLLRMLSIDYDIDLMYTFCDRKSTLYHNAELPNICRNVYSVKMNKCRMISQAILGFFKKRPLQCYYFYSYKLQNIIDQKIDSYDFVVCNNIRTAEYVINHSTCNKYIDYVDAISMHYEKAATLANFIWKFIYTLEAKRCLNYELEVLSKFNKAIIISDIDKNHILCKSQLTSKISVVPNSISIDKRSVSYQDNVNIVFVGTMDYEPNVIAVDFFCKTVFPIVKEEYSQAKFFIVGSRPTRRVCKLKSEDVIVTGYVDDPKEYLLNSAIVVAPMLTGAGLQNKILEAMSLGCVVVTTTLGSEGLSEVMNEKELFIIDDSKLMANLIIKLLLDVDVRAQIGKNAKEYVEKNYTFNSVYEKLKAIL
jgi:glycosyltransferase, family 1